jgi:hypothetical protein
MTARKSPRRSRRSNTNHAADSQHLVAQMAPSRVPIIVDPPSIQDTIRIVKRIQITLSQTTTGAVTLRYSDLMAGVPGGLTYWNSVRVERLDFWSMWNGQASNTIHVTIPTASSWGQPQSEWTDSGVPGKRRAHIGIRFGLIERSRFAGTATTDTLCLVSVDGSSTTEAPSFVTCQAVIELISPLPA